MRWTIIAEKRGDPLSRTSLWVFSSGAFALQGISTRRNQYPRHVVYLEAVNWPSLEVSYDDLSQLPNYATPCP